MTRPLSDIEGFARALQSAVETDDRAWSELAGDLDAWLLHGVASRFTDALAEAGALEDPHIYGWVHEALGRERREASFASHNVHESKHVDSVTATQIYTPRWVAELLLREAAYGAPADYTICDPACGGGQFLLVALEELVDGDVPIDVALTRIHGRDLDSTAVDAARRGLLAFAVTHGASRDAAMTTIETNVVVADGLEIPDQCFDIVVANPPYMGHRAMPPEWSARLRDEFRPFHLDLATAFIDRCSKAARHACGILSQQNIWYLSRFEDARRQMFERGQITLFAHFGPHLFDSLQGEKASVVGFVLRRGAKGQTRFIDLRELNSPAEMRDAIDERRTERPMREVSRLPGAPVAHWVPEPLFAAFGDDVPTVGELFEVPGSQNKTGRNKKYVRSASEVDDIAPLDAETSNGERWRYYSKGGRYAPWWGNWDWAVDWSKAAREFYRDNRTSNLLDERWVDRTGLVYTDFGGQTFNARWKPPTALFDMAGPAIFHPENDHDALYALLVYLNSEPARMLLNALNPSLHYQVRDVRRLPLPDWSLEASILGRDLVAAARDALDGGPVSTVFELERRANDYACARYGIQPTGALPRHHEL